MDEETDGTILANPVPSFDNPFRPHLESRVTEAKPFSFESRTQEMFQRREQRVNAVLEQEEKVHSEWLCTALIVSRSTHTRNHLTAFCPGLPG